ncbi:Lrp/AsnC ligand binding domain-containing protein [Paraburkholderia sp. D15]|uniref:Lrp/AsnC family transcriptional regulator n=1 Tax=Paraburkholderia sp. D15 TaxID=2880218 RepID=UPI002479DAEF|nr:Lrp/AsnC ligand binding domain-containing protein [Paraburkholderia sp. D15]WGS53091.1 Lrp/AsnC ligand binding domain-containing protein [Paraburkholderia sp. D15]
MNATKIRRSATKRASPPAPARTPARPESHATVAAVPADPLQSLDRIDRAILRQLQADASISNVALAAKVKLSAPACLRRVERLKTSGLIRGVVALIDPKAAGAGMLVIIGVVLDRSTPESFAAFEKAAQKVAGCMECHVVTGEFDYFMTIRTRDSDSFNRLHAEQLLYLPGVRQIRSFMVLKEILSTTKFPL